MKPLAGASMHKSNLPRFVPSVGWGIFFALVLRLWNKMLNSEETCEGLMFIGL